VTEARPYVIAVGGVPGAGKTALARDLADTLHLPALVRDEIKEGMHVTARSDDPAEVRRFADASFEVFWRTVQDLARAGVSLVAEAAFHRDRAAADFAATAALADVVLVWCRVEPSPSRATGRGHRCVTRHTPTA
jgi:predicted kinase